MPTFLDLSDPLVARALSNPKRHRILMALAEPQSISAVARRLGMNKGSVSHHVRFLVEANLVQQTDTVTGRGGTQVRYQRSYRQGTMTYQRSNPCGDAALAAVMTAWQQDPNAHLHHRTLRLTRQQAQHLKESLDAAVANLVPAPDHEPRYGVVVGVYAQTPQ